MPFVKGQSGNPEGLKPGTFLLMPFIRKKLQEVPEGEKETLAAKIIEAYLKDVLEKPEMKKDLLDRTDGRATQPIEGTGENGAISIEIRMI